MEDVTILLVDDQPVNLILLNDILEEAGYKDIRSTTDPFQVVPLCEEHAPDLILLDLAMPGLDGFQVLDRLKPILAKEAFLPILVLTADITPQAKERALRGGAKDFLTKPFEVTEILLRIGNLIETRRLHRRLHEHAMLLEERVRERTRELEEEVAERRQAEIALRQSESRYRGLVESTFDLIWSTDKNGRLTFVNPSWVKTMGYSAEEARELYLWDAMVPENKKDARERFQALLDNGVPRMAQAAVVTKDGRRLLLEGTFTPGRAADGSPYAHVIAHDVTERTRAERAQHEKELAEASSSAKSAMLANMSHELRTPLNSIIGFARVLENGSYGALNDRQSTYVKYVLRAGEHMLELVNDILDLRRVEADAFHLELRPVTLAAAIEDATIMVAAPIQDRRHTLHTEISEDTPAALADHGALVQVLVNLLSNAAKFTDPGGSITIRGRREGDFVAVDVIDTGIGIKPEDQERIFDYFVQLGGKRSQSMKGFGIGLALTRRLVELMNGQIKLESAVDVGTTFRVTLPAVPAAAGEQ